MPAATPLRRHGGMSDAEREVREDLAAAYRLVALCGMDDSIYTHISARVPGPDEHFLINAFGLTWDEITASSLVKVNLDGEIIDAARTHAAAVLEADSTLDDHPALREALERRLSQREREFLGKN